ncbi:hypothetical protein [Streptomyces collinus]|uniref:hypothetical protein n=1 Tax=Streptomyces collinus TaxID=42684 RepID=UPI003698019E
MHWLDPIGTALIVLAFGAAEITHLIIRHHQPAAEPARFHRPRQDAAGAPGILALVGINGLSWAKCTGRFMWDDRRVPAV